MPDILSITNHGPLITATDYWQSQLAARGLLYLSTNAGAFRLLVPLQMRAAISEMRPGARHVVVSMLPPDRWADGQYCAEWMVEDGSDSPWSCHLSPGLVARAIIPADAGQQWIATVWDCKAGRPHKSLERPAYAQIVPSLPWLRRIAP